MPALTIRNLPSDLVDRLKTRAKQNGRSMEQEAREILGQRLADRTELLSEIRSRRNDTGKPPPASEVSGWIKAGRRGTE